tara:strand:- start:91 stop:645 length:555 start_codon:yes stop_codon:yes gene_type:complete
MGVYVYVARKRPTDVRLGDGSVVQAYPLTYVSKLSMFSDFFYKFGRWYGDYKVDRMQIARSQKAFEYDKVEYVYISHFDKNPIPLEGYGLYKTSSLETADRMTHHLGDESSCYGGPEIFWADCDSLGELQGALVSPVRVGRKRGPWTLTSATEEMKERREDNILVESERRARKMGGKGVRYAFA